MSDNLCKLLTEKYPDQLSSWILGTPQSRVEVLKTEAMLERLNTLSSEQLENLGEALLDFDAVADLEAWFGSLE